MGNNNTQVTKRRVAISFFLFMIIFLMFLTTLLGFIILNIFLLL